MFDFDGVAEVFRFTGVLVLVLCVLALALKLTSCVRVDTDGPTYWRTH